MRKAKRKRRKKKMLQTIPRIPRCAIIFAASRPSWPNDSFVSYKSYTRPQVIRRNRSIFSKVKFDVFVCSLRTTGRQPGSETGHKYNYYKRQVESSLSLSRLLLFSVLSIVFLSSASQKLAD